MRHAALTAAASALLLCAGCKPAAAVGQAPVPPAAGADAARPAGGLTVQAQPDLGPQNQAMPRFSGGDAAATARINLAMDKLDALTLEGLGACPDMPHGGQTQAVRVTRNAPLLAIEVTYESDCGAYPSSGINSYVFDPATGALIDWARALPEAGVTAGEPDTEMFTNAFTSASLQARLVAAARKQSDADWRNDCLPVLEGQDLSLTARINTETHTLDITPDLPHVVQACGDSLSLGTADLTALKADPRLIEAVRQ